MKKMSSVVHFEMPYEDKKRMADFYTNVFGWQAQMLGEEMGNYVTVSTTEVDENRMPKATGAINGGFFPKTPDSPQHPSVVIGVEDIKQSVEEVKKAGGKIQGEPVEIPGIGLYVIFIDTEGNQASMIQPIMR